MAGTEALTAAAEPETQAPQFQEGFTIKTVIGAIFIALFMLPGGIYLGLVAGQSVQGSAEWVTIVLFAEVARRSFQPLRKQEIYILFYVCSGLVSAINLGVGLGGGPFAGLVWNAYFVSSPPAAPIARQIPTWAVPHPDSMAILHRELWHRDWWWPIALLLVTDLCGRFAWLGMGYALFRVTSDIEKLPFPMAPVNAAGATALAEAGTESWRWSIFSTGAVIGMIFGAIYVGIPVITGVLFGTAVQVLPIPFADYTTNIENLLPAAIVCISLNLGNVLVGFILPYEVVLGAAIASVLGMIVLNPLLFHLGLLPNYHFGSPAIIAMQSVTMDFWLSVGIGLSLSVALIGVILVVRAVGEFRRQAREQRYLLSTPAGRGDVPIAMALMIWAASALAMIVLCHFLVPRFPLWILVFFGLIWSPMNSYVSARMIGMTTRGVGVPYLMQASVVLSGYHHVDVWYAPIPLADHGWAAQRFREVELTETKFTSVVKAELLMFAVIMPASFAIWAFFWNSNPLPSAQFPWSQKFWPPAATMQSVWQQINAPGGGGWFKNAIKPTYIAGGAVGGIAVYLAMSALHVPLLFYYGFIGGLTAYPGDALPQLFGAWLGRRFLKKRFGEDNWPRYAPVLLAGFFCGNGLAAVVSISLALIAKAVTKMPY
jgi:hypothetical protein